MLRYFFKRLASLLASLAIASVIIFAVIEIVPGDPASYMLGINASEDTLEALRNELGLNRGVFERYFTWVAGLVSGDFGISYAYRSPVSELIYERLLVSLPLALMALFLAIIIAFPVGIIAATKRGSLSDISIMGATQIGIAIPNFWFGTILVSIFAIWLGWFASGGFPGWENGAGKAILSLILPAIALALPQASILARIMRTALLDTLGEDYIRTARAKGLSKGQALRRHALRNALIPVLTIIGLQFSFLLAGAIIIENVFYLPGLGRLIFQAIAQRDLIVVESVIMILVFAVIIVNFTIDIAYAIVDPRLRRR